MPDGTYRFETGEPTGSQEDMLLLKGADDMGLSEEVVSAPGKVAELGVNEDGLVRKFERKYPWLDEEKRVSEAGEVA
jgi:hypothetical protein